MGNKNAGVKLLESSFELFSKNGYSATTTKEIAQHAGVNEVTVFRIFGTKENLFSEMIDNYANVEKISKHVHPAVTGDPQKDLKRLCQNMLKTITVRNKLIRLIMSNAPDNPIIKKKLNKFPIGLMIFISEYLQEIIPADKQKGKDFEMASMILLSYFLRFSMSTSLLGKDPLNAQTERNIDRFIKVFLHGFLEGEEL